MVLSLMVPGPAVRAWKPGVAGIREVLHLGTRDHAYPPHTHDVWTLFIVDEGAIRYDLHDRHCGAEGPMVSLLPPHVVHDGRPATSAGYRKRVLYVETSLLGEHLIGPAVDRPVVPDPGLRGRIAALHQALECADDALEAETRLAFVVERIARSLGEVPAAIAPGGEGQDADRLRSFLDSHLFEPVTMAEAAAAMGSTPTRLARAFSSVFGIPPHAYVLGRRLEAARDRILEGQPLADVAAEVGFYDQAHLSRRFKQFLGTTPGTFRGGSVLS